MFSLLLEDNAVTAIYNNIKTSKDKCDYLCGQKFSNDKFLQPKLNVCRANCDVIWEKECIKQIQNYISTNSSNLNGEFLANLRNRLNMSKKRLFNAQRRLVKTKQMLRKVLYGRRADMSMSLPKSGPVFES
jgi:hypothetical protein